MARITHHNFLRFALDVWEKFQTYSPKLWFFMVMNPMGSSPSKKNQLKKYILGRWLEVTNNVSKVTFSPSPKKVTAWITWSPGNFLSIGSIHPSKPRKYLWTEPSCHCWELFPKILWWHGKQTSQLGDNISWKQKWLDGDPLKHQGSLTS